MRQQWQERATELETQCSLMESELRSVSTNAKDRITSFESELEVARQTNSDLQTTVDAFENRITALGEELSSHLERANCAKMERQSELAAATSKHCHLQGTVEDSRKTIVSLEASFDQYYAKVLKLEGALNVSHQEFCAMRTELDETTAKLVEKEASEHELVERLESKQAELTEREDRQRQLDEALVALRGQLEKREIRQEAMERTLEAIHEQMIEKDVQEKEICQALKTGNENEVSVLRNALGTVEKKVESLEDELMTVERERGRLVSECSTLQCSLDSNGAECRRREDTLNAAIASAQDQNVNLKAELDQAQSFIDEVKVEMREVEAKINTMAMDSEQESAQLAAAVEQLAAEKEKTVMLETEMSRCNAERDLEATARISELESVKTEAACVAVSMKSKAREAQFAQESSVRYKTQATDAQEENGQLRKQLQELRAEMDRDVTAVKTAHEKKESELQAAMESTMETSEMFRLKSEKCDETIRSLNDRVDRLQREIEDESENAAAALGQLQDEKDSFVEKLNEKDDRLRETESALEEKVERVHQVEQQLEELRCGEWDEIKARLGQVEMEREALKDEIRRAEEEFMSKREVLQQQVEKTQVCLTLFVDCCFKNFGFVG